MTKLHSLLEPVAPTEAESQLAFDASRRISRFLSSGANRLEDDDDTLDDDTIDLSVAGAESLTLQIGDEGKGTVESVTLPASTLPLLRQMLTELGQGHAVALLPMETELSTEQAAKILKVSRPFLVGLLEDRQLPSRKVGKHRRVLLRDVLAYKARDEAQRHAILDELAAQAQALDMGY